jgi:hypothetical protein
MNLGMVHLGQKYMTFKYSKKRLEVLQDHYTAVLALEDILLQKWQTRILEWNILD